MALFKKVKSERFAALNAIKAARISQIFLLLYYKGNMNNLQIFDVDPAYIEYLAPYAEHLFKNKKPGQHFERKYIGVIIEVHGFKYFAPLSSFKPKHAMMRESLDFLKIKDYAVVNLNNMFPVPEGVYHYIDISRESDRRYKELLLAEYRIIKSMQNKICKNAEIVYSHKIQNGIGTSLAKRCNDFSLLESLCISYG